MSAWSSVGTREISPKPRKTASAKIVRLRPGSCSPAPPPSGARPFVGDAVNLDDLVLEVELERALLDEQREEALRGSASTSGRPSGRHRARQVERADDRDARDLDGLARLVSSQFPPASAARSTTTEPRRLAHRLARQQDGRRPPGMSAVVMTPSASAAAAAATSPARAGAGLRWSPPRTRPRSPARDLELEERRRAEALDLLAGGRADVECGDKRRRACARWRFLGGPRLAPSGTSTRAGVIVRCRGPHRKELAEGRRDEEHGLVAGHRALGGQRVHGLRARDPGHRAGENPVTPLGEGSRELGLGQRLQEADERGALREERDLVLEGLRTLADDVGAERVRRGGDRGARSAMPRRRTSPRPPRSIRRRPRCLPRPARGRRRARARARSAGAALLERLAACGPESTVARGRAIRP